MNFSVTTPYQTSPKLLAVSSTHSTLHTQPPPVTYDLGHLSRSSCHSWSVIIQPRPGKKSLRYSSSGADALIRDSLPAGDAGRTPVVRQG